MSGIYLDYASTTPVRREVVEEMQKYFSEEFGNPSSVHALGEKAREAVENSRKKIAKVLGCTVSEIIFTSGGTESNNLALKGFAFANKNKGKHIIVSKIEHPCVLETCKYLERNGFEISYVGVNSEGIVDLNELKKLIRKDTIMISVMYANNEIGTIQPIQEICKIAHEKHIVVHTDACQATGYLNVNVGSLDVDMMTINSGKIYGPKGVGALFIKKGIVIEPLLHGGGQEFGLRSGTENVAGIAGFAKAIELIDAEKNVEFGRVEKLKNKLLNGLLEKISGIRVNGSLERRLPNNINISINKLEAESLLAELSELGIYASAGSACAEKKLEPSHVLKAIDLSDNEANGTIRLSLGKFTIDENIDKVLDILPRIVNELRN